MLVAEVRQFFVKSGITPCEIVAAVSGGVDSTALLLALADLRPDGFRLSAAHVNHHLRGADSDADEAFVRDLCRRLGVPLHVADGDLDPALTRHRGIEAAARAIRYEKLRELAGERLVATAHQKNDQAETVLMRLLTGSGIAGLRGIHPLRGDRFVRPLLDITREAIERFLREQDVTPRFDRSNDDPRFLRNRIRGLVRELHAVDNLAAAAAEAREQWPVLERLVDDAEAAARAGMWAAEAWLRRALLERLIRELDPEARGFDARRLAEELDRVKRVSVTKHVELIRRGDALLLERRAETPDVPEFEVELTAGTPVYIPELDLTVGVEKGLGGRGQRFAIDGEPRFVVRNRRRGDRFQPLGLTVPKKLKDFLIDRKIPAGVRDRLPLLVWNGEIVWVGGVEVSERFKVTTAPAGMLYEVWMEGSGAEHHSRLHPRLYDGTDSSEDR
ncbi:MAG TPA: tRNA lysidine(34) synthetase TilS [Thermoanaerobaculia bacterium]|nr:tRNA lysidine(34) synthetase TilS [Thermoanaerobaculia bacterium]